VSLQSALSHHGLIPEFVPVTTSVTTGRPEELEAPLGRFMHCHVKTKAFFGYTQAANFVKANPAIGGIGFCDPSADTRAWGASLFGDESGHFRCRGARRGFFRPF